MSELVKVKRDIEKDARNWWEASNQLSYGYDFSKNLPEEIRKKVKGKKWGETKNFLKLRIKEKYERESGLKFLQDEFLPYWDKKEKEIMDRLNKIHKNKFPAKFVNIYYTSCKRCPYGKEGKGFWIQLNGYNKNKDLLVSIIIHELMHLYFLKYYANLCLKKGLTKEQKEDIKEAFTILMNEEFKGVVKVKDEGYKMHQNIRKFILKRWKKSKDFKKVLLDLTRNLKENGIVNSAESSKLNKKT